MTASVTNKLIALGMEMISLKPERKAQLDKYAQRHGQDPAAALDEALGAHLEWERQDFEGSVANIQRGYDDVQAGRSRPAADFLAELRRRHEFPD